MGRRQRVADGADRRRTTKTAGAVRLGGCQLLKFGGILIKEN
jgi:hypothetical protein